MDIKMIQIIKQMNTQLYRLFLLGVLCTFSFANPPDWVDNPGGYESTATISGVIILRNGIQMGEEGDMLAAFDEEENVRGVGLMLLPPFGQYEGTPVFEVQLRSNSAGDNLHFKYYDASEDKIFYIVETYEFSINEILGNVENPIEFNLELVTLSFHNAHSTGIDINYESNTEIAGFQFNVGGVNVTNAGGGEAEDEGFMLTTGNNTIIGFSLSGAIIPIGSGTLITLGFEGINGNVTLTIDNVVVSGSGGNSIQSNGPGSIEINSPPGLFSYNQSTLQAFYYFKLVLINDENVESNDWVGAFNGDICVGARQWDTTQCGGEICDVPVMGVDGNEYTIGYMLAGDIPTFKIYDASENLYYTAESSENSGWFSNGMPVAEILSANVSILGCTDPDYCNYDPSATEDDDSCNYLCTGCTDESACNFSENATIDDGSCYYEGENYNCDGNCIPEIDCAGVCGGNALEDDCEVCGGDNTSCTDCAGVTNGTAFIDDCGACVSEGDTSCIQGCDGKWKNDGSHTLEDECGVCGGDNSSCIDCTGTPNGSALSDNCGTCDSDASNDCVQDCAGDWGGTLIDDICGICGGTVEIVSNCGCSNNLVMDCAGLCGGSAMEDDCNICGGDNNTCADCSGAPNGTALNDNCSVCDSDSENDCVQGCDGIWGSGLVVDECGVCDGDNSSCEDCAEIPNGDNKLDYCGNCDSDADNDCTQDCTGEWGGAAEIDECDICDGAGPEENYDCDGNCIGEVNCLGECDAPDGQYSPNFQCQNGNVVCNPADCNSLDVPIYLLPDEFGISKIFPNPFNPVTQINYEITQYGLVTVKIFDIQGREVDQLISGYQNPGHFNLTWNAGNNASGMYFVAMTLQSGNTTISRDMKKILYLK